MKKDQLEQIVQSGESQEVEFKESFHSSQDFSKILCAFTNTFGGIVILGVNNKKEIKGVTGNIDEIQQKISSAAQAVSPPIIPSIEVQEIENKKIITITVQRAIDNTFHTFQGVIWVRVGSTMKRIEGNQIVNFLRTKQILSFDETPSNATINDIDAGKVRGYLATRKQKDFLSTHSIEDFLLNTNLAAKNGKLRIKNSALLFFAKNPMQFNPQIEIKLVRFEGTEPVKIISHELIQADLIEGIERSVSFVNNNISKSIEIKNTTKRKEKYEYPLNVIREAIINAIAHRDYFSKDAIQIYLFKNRIEITNPGSLPQGLPKELFGTISVQRNPLTYRILRDYDYVEGIGSGIPRMINAMREHNLQDPEFGIYEQFFRVTLKNKQGTQKPINEYEDLNQRQKKALQFTNKNKSIKTKTYEKINKVSQGTATKEINEMVKFGYLKKVGKYRGAYYIVKNNNN